MPSVSKKQHNLMAAVANNPKFAKKAGIPQSVGEEFMKADKGKNFRAGGLTNPAKGKFNKPRSNHGMMQMPNVNLEKFAGKKSGGYLFNEEKKGSTMKKMNPGMMAMMAKKKSMKSGGMPMVMKDGKKVPAFAADGKGKMKHGGTVKKMAGGGLAAGHKQADGVASKGKTKAMQVKMKKGGYC
jgi:hypothetical protein